MAFAMGDAAILIQGSWAIGQMNAYNPDIEEKCGVFQFPAIEGGGDPGRTIAKSDSLAVSATSKCPEGAVELIKYFTDDEAQKYTAEFRLIASQTASFRSPLPIMAIKPSSRSSGA